MTLADILDGLGVQVANWDDVEEILSAPIAIHQQQNYPLKSRLDHFCMLDGELALAAGAATEYGSKEAWEVEGW